MTVTVSTTSSAPHAPVDSFVDRAQQLVAFLAEPADAAGAARRREQDLAAWISRWREAPSGGLAGTQHFVAEELGIIMRALSGPADAPARLREADNERMCWLIARCMAEPG